MSPAISLFADVTLERLTSRDGGTATLPPFVFGDTKTFTLTLQERTTDGIKERFPNVRSVRAALGKVMEPATAGFFRFRKPGTVTYPPETSGSSGSFVQMRALLITKPSTSEILLEIHAPAGDFESLEASLDYFKAAASGAVLIDYDAAAGLVSARALIEGAEHLQLEFEDPDGASLSITGEAFEGEGMVDGPQVAYNCSAATFAEQIAGYVGGYTVAEVQNPTAGVYLVRFNQDGEAPIAINAGELSPASFARVRAYQIGAVLWHEVAFYQTPAAFTGSFERVLPPAPRIERVRSGAARVVGSSANTNEVQRLYLPPNFTGSYSLTFDYRRTVLVGPQDGPEEIAAYLNQLYKDAKTRFVVTNPEDDFAYIEFTGPLEASAQPLIGVTVHSFSPGVITFSLFLGRPEMAALLRDKTEIELPLEIELEILEDDEDPATAGPGRLVTIAQQKLKVFREQIYPELAEVPAIDWRKPPTPRSYIPFSPLQVITGQQHYVATIGDGVARSFSITHGLGTPALSSVVVRENITQGRYLVHGLDFTAKAGDDENNELFIDIPSGKPTPAAAGLALVITSAGPRSAFQDHPHTIPQVTGLEDALAALGSSIADIQDRLPFTTPGVRDDDAAEDEEIELADFFAQYPGRYDSEDFQKPQKPTRAPALLPAIHDATPETLPLPLQSAAGKLQRWDATTTLSAVANIGQTFLNVTSAAGLSTGDTIRVNGIPITYTVGTIAGGLVNISPAYSSNTPAGAVVERQATIPYRGNVWQYTGTAPLVLPGGLGKRSATVQTGDKVGSDGRLWYPLSNQAGTNSFYPREYERELFLLPINSEQLRPGGSLSLEFTAALQAIAANVRMQAVLVVEIGQALQETTPAPIGVNLSEITWNPTPLLAQRFILSGQRAEGKFGAAIRRALDDTMSADRKLYGVWSAAAAAPTSANFVLRGRLIEIDTENAPADARGALWVSMTEAKATLSNA